MRGRPIALGCTVAFPRKYGSQTWLVHGKVIAFEERKAYTKTEAVIVVEGPDKYSPEHREHRTGKLDQVIVVES